jgi:hypothetical protein
VPDKGPALLRVMIATQGKSFIGFDGMKVMEGDTVLYQKDFASQQVQRGDNAAGKYEAADIVALPTDVLALEKIAQGGKVVLQLSHKDKTTDFTLSDKAKKNIADTLEAYKALDPLKGV